MKRRATAGCGAENHRLWHPLRRIAAGWLMRTENYTTGHWKKTTRTTYIILIRVRTTHVRWFVRRFTASFVHTYATTRAFSYIQQNALKSLNVCAHVGPSVAKLAPRALYPLYRLGKERWVDLTWAVVLVRRWRVARFVIENTQHTQNSQLIRRQYYYDPRWFLCTTLSQYCCNLCVCRWIGKETIYVSNIILRYTWH